MRTTNRNYQLDFLKLVFSLFVVWGHSESFIKDPTRDFIPHAIGVWAVFFFFIVSGMLMVLSLSKIENVEDYAQSSFDYCAEKAKRFFGPCVVSLLIHLVVFCVLLIKDGADISVVMLVKVIPQILFLTSTSIDSFMLNSPAWYISAMVIVMLPMSYLLLRDRKRYLLIISPLVAVGTYAWFRNLGEGYFVFYEYYGWITAGIIWAVCGICFGAICYLILEWIYKRDGIVSRIQMTAFEILIWGTIFCVWFSKNCDKDAAYSVMLLMPAAIAITFSGKSYISNLFFFDFLKHLPDISLAIFLNHATAWRIVNTFFGDSSYQHCVEYMILFTGITSMLYFAILRLSKVRRKI